MPFKPLFEEKPQSACAWTQDDLDYLREKLDRLESKIDKLERNADGKVLREIQFAIKLLKEIKYDSREKEEEEAEIPTPPVVKKRKI